MRLTQGFSEYHGHLLDLCFMEMDTTGGGRKTKKSRKAPVLEKGGNILTLKDLVSLTEMVEMEFIASLRQQLYGQTMWHTSDPHPFDVYLIRATRRNTKRNEERRPSKARRIAVCMPSKKGLMWWDGQKGHGCWPIHPPCHVRRISSLSGSARILEALHKAQGIFMSDSCSLVSAGMDRRLIFQVDPFDSLPAPCKKRANLNNAQQQAVDALSTFESGFFCIQGPPGCGKTTSMVQMILAAKEQNSVIVVAPSNAAVANVALKLYETGLVPFGQMIVFGNNCHESVRFLPPKFRSEKYSDFLHDCRIAQTEQKRKQPALVRKLTGDLTKWLHLPQTDDQEWTLPDIARQCPRMPMGSFADEMKFISGMLSEADVVLCTLNSAGSGLVQTALSKKGKAHPFHTLMLDEGGQCTEAEFFIATTFPGIKRIVVMGDPKQLRPTVIAPQCEVNGFGNSFLLQVYKKDVHCLHLLDTQYRMDPIILRFPNQQFYGGRIKNGENVHHREPPVENPFLFHDTDGKGQETKVGLSWQNQYEVSVINDILRSDVDIIRLIQTGIDGETKVIVITPYKSQMTLLQEKVQLPPGSKARIIVNTVDAFQGQEGDVVIVSTVRTNKPGFVDNPERLNVALTRAKRVLRVVGEHRFFQKLEEGSTLRTLALQASEHGLVRTLCTNDVANAGLNSSLITHAGGAKKKKQVYRYRQ